MVPTRACPTSQGFFTNIGAFLRRLRLGPFGSITYKGQAKQVPYTLPSNLRRFPHKGPALTGSGTPELAHHTGSNPRGFLHRRRYQHIPSQAPALPGPFSSFVVQTSVPPQSQPKQQPPHRLQWTSLRSLTYQTKEG